MHLDFAHQSLLIGFGVLILLVTWLPLLLRDLPLSLPIVCVGAGYALEKWSYIPIEIPTQGVSDLSEQLTQLVVLIAVMGSGLKIDRKLGWRSWNSTWRLLGMAMPATIILVAIAAFFIGALPLATALLIGAAIAPTDPVLASEVDVGPPGKNEEGEVRFALTSEAGLNDGLAFPFVLLAIALTSNVVVDAQWLFVHFIWRVGLAIACGWLLGKAFGFIVYHIPKLNLSTTGEGLAMLGLTLLSYSLTELIYGYGFVAVFITALTVRSAHKENKFNRSMADFGAQVERFIAMLLLVYFGIALAGGLLDALTTADIVLVMCSLLIFRPLVAWLSLIGTPHPAISRAATAFFGIRGIGTLFYLTYSLNHAHFAEAPRLKAILAFTVLCSVILHGLTSTPLMRRLDRIRTRQGSRAAPAPKLQAPPS